MLVFKSELLTSGAVVLKLFAMCPPLKTTAKLMFHLIAKQK